MVQTIKKVLVVGAGGHLGPSVLAALERGSHFTISILARDSSKSIFPSHIPVIRVGDEYPEADLLKAFKGQDAVISTIATAAAKQQKRLIDAAVKTGVKRFVPAEFGSDTMNDKALALLPNYFTGKRTTWEYLQSKEKDGLTWTAFVTGPFFELAMQGWLGFNIAERKGTIYDDGNAIVSSTTLVSIGIAIKNALLKPSQTANKRCYISSFNITQNELLSALENITGDKFEVMHVIGEEQKTIGKDMLSKGNMVGAMKLMQHIVLTKGYGGDYALYAETSNGLLGIPLEELEVALKKVMQG